MSEDQSIPKRDRDHSLVSCPECRSKNIASDSVLRRPPSICAVILFGWVFLLVRAAFVKKTAVCWDCGAIHRYRSGESVVAMVLLILLVGLIVVTVWGGLPE
ncbi:MAG: hypothetical protein ABGZ49_02785 [Akkermansiaceae bacterium]